MNKNIVVLALLFFAFVLNSCGINNKIGNHLPLQKDGIEGIWQLVQSKVLGDQLLERRTTMFKVYNTDGTSYIFAPVPEMQTVLVVQYGTYKKKAKGIVVEKVIKRAFNNKLNNKELNMQYNIENSEVLFIRFTDPITGKELKEQWNRVKYM